MKNEKLIEIIIESMLYAADPSFFLCEERSPHELETALKQLVSMAGETMDKVTLENVRFFVDKESEENQFFSNIKQLLGDKLKTTEDE